MASQFIDYRPLPGRTLIALGNVQRLYAGPDHLLLLTTSYFTETYKRFYYGDIQAITVQKTSMGAVLNALLGVSLFILSLLVAMPFMVAGEGWIVAAVIAAILAFVLSIALVVNLVQGPTCECRILTAVHQERLSSLGRIRAARKAVASLRPIIDTVQGVVDTEAAANAVSTIPAGPEPRVTNAGAYAPATQTTAVLRRDSGNVHMALFLFVFVDAAVRLVAVVYPALAPYVLVLLMTLVLLCLIVAALVRQHRSDMPSPLRNTVWALFVYACFLSGVVYIFEVARQMEMQLGSQGQPMEFTQFRQAITLGANAVAVVCDLVLGALGFVFLRGYLRSNHTSEAAGPGL